MSDYAKILDSIMEKIKALPKVSSVTQETSGLMTPEDKIKLDNIATGANKTVVDTSLSSTSTNPVQNNVIYSALSNKAPSVHSHTVSEISDFPSSLPANGGNADTLGGFSSDDFIVGDSSQIDIPANADVPIWIHANAKRYTTYRTVGSSNGYTNLPDNNTNYVWYVYIGHYIIALVNDNHRLYFCDMVNGVFSGWKKFAITSELSGSYTLPTATSSVLGGVKIGSNITNSSGTISLTKSNVTTALGYTPLDSKYTPYSYTAVQALGWSDASTGALQLITSNAIAYWNGAFKGTTSNLAYCNRGAFGTIVTKNTGDYLPISGGTLTGILTCPGLELSYTTPCIDFHFNNSTADYTSRIRETSAGTLAVYGQMYMAGNNTNYTSSIYRDIAAGTGTTPNGNYGGIYIQYS